MYKQDLMTSKISNTKVLPLSTMQQEEDFYCGPASMDAIVSYFAQEVLEEKKLKVTQDILFAIGRNAEKYVKSIEHSSGYKRDDEGIGHLGILSMANEFGLHGFIKNNGSIEDIVASINDDVPVLINFQFREADPLGENGHYAVIKGYQNYSSLTDENNPLLIIADPFISIPLQEYSLSYKDLLSQWFDIAGGRRYERWMASFFPPSKDLKMPSRGFYLRENNCPKII